MGNDRVTVSNLEVVKVDAERNLLLIKSNTGIKGTLLTIKETVKKFYVRWKEDSYATVALYNMERCRHR